MRQIALEIHEPEHTQMKAYSYRKMYQMATNWREMELQQGKVSCFEKYNLTTLLYIKSKAEHKTKTKFKNWWEDTLTHIYIWHATRVQSLIPQLHYSCSGLGNSLMAAFGSVWQQKISGMEEPENLSIFSLIHPYTLQWGS